VIIFNPRRPCHRACGLIRQLAGNSAGILIFFISAPMAVIVAFMTRVAAVLMVVMFIMFFMAGMGAVLMRVIFVAVPFITSVP